MLLTMKWLDDGQNSHQGFDEKMHYLETTTSIKLMCTQPKSPNCLRR